MIKEGLNIFISKPLDFVISPIGMVKVWVLDNKAGRHYEITQDKETKFLQSKLLEENNPEELTPFIELSSQFFERFAQAIAEFASNNMKTENENLLIGKHEAAQKHLDDMRRIVFKDFNPITN